MTFLSTTKAKRSIIEPARPPITRRRRRRNLARKPGADWAYPCSRLGRFHCSPAESRWAHRGIMSVVLPGTTAAFTDANIYARATGYIAKRNVDIGDSVKQGELLVELAVPELDDQISQNEATLTQLKAALEQAQANLKLGQVTWDRDRPLAKEGWG